MVVPSICAMVLPLGDLRTQLAALRKQTSHLAYRPGEIGFRIRHRDLRIRRIELQQGLSGAHGLGVIGVQGEHRARHFAGDLHHVAIDIGVVRRFEIPAVEEPVSEVTSSAQSDDGAQGPQPGAARAPRSLAGARIGRGFFVRSVFVRSLVVRRLVFRSLVVHGLFRVKVESELGVLTAAASAPVE
jgi:hypothetical protein